MIIYKNLKDCSVEQITAAFNSAFEGYEIPLRFELADFERKLRVENFSPDHSIGAFNENNELIAFIIHCISADGSTLYNSGTGVIAAYRGSGLTRKMYAYGLQQGIFQGVSDILLEVLVNNRPAYKSYVDVGFQLIRHFNSYTGYPTKLSLNHLVEQTVLSDDLVHQLHVIATTKPSWQNDFLSMALSKDFLEVYCIKADCRIVAYLLYNPLSKRIHQVAVDKAFRGKGMATSLFSALYAKHPNSYSMINVDANDQILNKFLKDIGFKLFVSLDELNFKIKK